MSPPGAGRRAPSAATVARFAALGAEVQRLSAAGAHAQALTVAQQALRLAPGHPVVMGDLALCHMRLGRPAQALPLYEAAVRAAPGNENLLDGLTECCGHLQRPADVRRHGQAALQLKHAQTAKVSGLPLPAAVPMPFDTAAPQRHVIAFSLFGAQPRYGETAVLNLAAARTHLPGWQCRFYVDDSVPADVRRRLAEGGAQLIDMPQHAVQGCAPLMWRFLVLDDPQVDRFLLRDADSLIGAREAAAVAAWLCSPRWFHLMRDAPSHSELLLAGMWGGCSGVFRGVAAQLVAYSKTPPALGARLIDQHWLRHHAWPTVRQSVLSHDPVFGFWQGEDFPPHADEPAIPGFHVGGNIAAAGLGGTVDGPDGTPVHWRLVDEAGQEVCRYRTPSRGGQWSVGLPQPYTQALQAGRWRFETLR